MGVRTWPQRAMDTMPYPEKVEISDIDGDPEKPDADLFVTDMQTGEKLFLKVEKSFYDGEPIKILRYWSGICWEYWDLFPEF